MREIVLLAVALGLGFVIGRGSSDVQTSPDKPPKGKPAAQREPPWTKQTVPGPVRGYPPEPPTYYVVQPGGECQGGQCPNQQPYPAGPYPFQQFPPYAQPRGY